MMVTAGLFHPSRIIVPRAMLPAYNAVIINQFSLKIFKWADYKVNVSNFIKLTWIQLMNLYLLYP